MRKKVESAVLRSLRILRKILRRVYKTFRHVETSFVQGRNLVPNRLAIG